MLSLILNMKHTIKRIIYKTVWKIVMLHFCHSATRVELQKVCLNCRSDILCVWNGIIRYILGYIIWTCALTSIPLRNLAYILIQGDSVARGPKLLFIKHYVIDIMTWKFICTYRERWKTGPDYNRCWNWSPFTSKHNWMRFSKFWNTFTKVSKLTAWISWRVASLSCSNVRGVFLFTLPFNGPQRKKSSGVRSGDLGGQKLFEIILSLRKLSISRMLAFEVWHVAPSCW